MSAFNFDLRQRNEDDKLREEEENDKCVSNSNMTCTYDDGMFNFDGYEISVGNSLENNCGGIGGFVGPNHEYFLYCGSKYPEISLMEFDEDTNEWGERACMQWDDFDIDDDHKSMFETIWFTKEEPALIFQFLEKYRIHAMEHEDLAEGMWCIKLDLSTGLFTGISRRQFNKQKHSALDKNSIWPLDSSGNDSSEDDDSGSCCSGDTLCGDESPPYSPQLENPWNQFTVTQELLEFEESENERLLRTLGILLETMNILMRLELATSTT
ncbi:hypothetical protein AA0117_g13403 [Alternaria alternata]|jgi:hypothetical protein|uniref:Uncharacterized protein n=1 Tax=Alternaria alternata TaxID=5599 RepID=A0A4Q4MHJ7_ALTAL|nr:hypothetical protein AALT_g11939 [Alternaria alternata]RYN50574.1 hypothetical protein AA0117_g13403 [Alternaria alternata]